MSQVDVLTSSKDHPVVFKLYELEKKLLSAGHTCKVVFDKSLCVGGDFLFLVSCGDFISADIRKKYKHVIVAHASDLPRGRGWSPYIWDILNGKNSITVCLISAEDKIDSGDIWLKQDILLEGGEILAEIHEKLFESEVFLIEKFVNEYGQIVPKAQDKNVLPTYFPKRTPNDSRLDIDQTIKQQIDLLRVVDNERFPAFFDYKGKRYILHVFKEELLKR